MSSQTEVERYQKSLVKNCLLNVAGEEATSEC